MEVEKKRLETFLQDNLVKDKKSIFEPFCKARLITRSKKKKKFLKPLSSIKKVSQALGLLVNKAVTFTEAFKFTITLVPLAVATSACTVYKPEKAGLRNYIINLSKSSSHEYPRDVKWMLDGLAAMRLAPPHATYDIWFKTPVTCITLPVEA